MPKGKQTIHISLSDEDNSVDDEEDEEDEEESYTSIRLLEDREDDNFIEEDEELTESQEFEEESESDQEEFVKSAEAFDDDEEFSENDHSEDDNYEGGDRKETKPIDKGHYDKVVSLLRQRRKVDVLKLEECKAYLRKHELMLSGSKATCVQRILEHWRLKDGSGERLYPKSSFTINCTGDVCKGDVVMFKQRVYEKFNLVSRNGEILGKRTLAGRVVKESYGSAKQQHTFTIEVLWNKGVKPLPLLYPLLVKGRNLYRYKTFRQHWGNEAERSKVLEEKHRRGATARQVRASTKNSNTAGFKRKRACSVSRQQDCIKLPNKHSGVTYGKKELKARVESNSSNKKCARGSSSVKHSNKKHGTKAPPPLSKPFSEAANSLQASSNFQNFRDRPHVSRHKRNSLEAPQAGREQSHVPVYNNYSHNAMQAPYTVYASQYVDQRGYLGHPYLASSRSSAHFVRPDAYDRRLSSFHTSRGEASLGLGRYPFTL